MGKQIICAVCGKNIDEIGNGLSETYYKNAGIKISILSKISEFAAKGVTDFISNCEYGFPLWVAETVLALRSSQVQQGSSPVRLHIVMPHEEQPSEWSDEVHERFYNVHANADSVLMLYSQYRDDCYENCDRVIIDNSDFLYTDNVCLFPAQYAKLNGKPIFVNDMLERVLSRKLPN